MTARHALHVLCAATILALVAAPADARFKFVRQIGMVGNGDGQLFTPYGLDVFGETLWVADSGHSRLQQFAVSTGIFVRKVTSAGSPTPIDFHDPLDLAFDATGTMIYVPDQVNNRIVKLTSEGSFVLDWGTLGFGDGELNFPGGIGVDWATGNVFVADTRNHRIQKFDASGSFLKKWGKNGGDGTFGAGDGEFYNPADVAVVEGAVYVTDESNHRVQKFDTEGTFLKKWGKNGGAGGSGSAGSGPGEFNFPDSVAVQQQAPHHVFVVEPAPNVRVQRFDAEGVLVETITGDTVAPDDLGAVPGQFAAHGVAVINHAEPFSTALYVADGEEHRVLAFREVSPTTTTTLPPGEPIGTLAQFSGKVEVQIQGGTWMPATPGIQLRVGDRIHTAFRGQARLELANGPLDIKPMSYVTLSALGARSRVQVRLGEVAGQVGPSHGVPADYEVSTPTAVAGVRGTIFSVLDDPGSEVTVVSAQEGVVEVTPTNASLPAVTLNAGQEVLVTSTSVSDVAAIGQAGAPPGGVGASEARALVLAAVERGADRCRVTLEGTTREAGDALTLGTFKRGWKATVRLVKLARSKPGIARFKVIGSKVKGGNPLAKKVVKCGR